MINLKIKVVVIQFSSPPSASAFLLSSSSFLILSSSLLSHLNLAKYTASNLLESWISTLQKRVTFGFTISTSAMRRFKEEAFLSTGQLRTLMSVKAGYMNNFTNYSRFGILLLLKLRYYKLANSGSSSSIFSILFFLRCSFLKFGKFS